MGFYDAKGHWRNDDEGFYDYRGNFVSPGGAFYDAKGYLRSPGDSFYDSKGNLVSPGQAFYDGNGVLQTPDYISPVNDHGWGLFGICALLLTPIITLWAMALLVLEWITTHLYLVAGVYLLTSVILSCLLVKARRYRGINMLLGFLGNFFTILSFLYVLLIYAIPYIYQCDAGMDGAVEFTLALALCGGAIVVLQFLIDYFEKPGVDFALGTLFFLMILLVLKYGTTGMNTLESLASIYHVSMSAWLRFLFSLAVLS